jgi:hypothetical protein
MEDSGAGQPVVNVVPYRGAGQHQFRAQGPQDVAHLGGDLVQETLIKGEGVEHGLTMPAQPRPVRCPSVDGVAKLAVVSMGTELAHRRPVLIAAHRYRGGVRGETTRGVESTSNVGERLMWDSREHSKDLNVGASCGEVGQHRTRRERGVIEMG